MKSALFLTTALVLCSTHAFAQCKTSTPSGKVSAGFTVSGGQIIGPNGQPFHAQGIDILESTLPSVVSDSSGAPLLDNFPNTNMVRIAMESGYGSLNDSGFVNAVEWLTARGIVVEIGNYNVFQTAPMGADLQAEVNWFTQLATRYKDNPYVWFSTGNEPEDTSVGLPAGSVTAEQAAVYGAIRQAGNTNMVGLEPLPRGSAGLQPAQTYQLMFNVHWDAHFYNWETGYSQDVGSNVSQLNSDISSYQAITSADGQMPVVIGEFGDSTNGSNIDPGGTQAVAAVLQVGPSCDGWTAWIYYWPGNMNAGMPGDELTNENTGQLTPYGQQVQAGMTQGPATAAVLSGPAVQPPNADPSPAALGIVDNSVPNVNVPTPALPPLQTGGPVTPPATPPAATAQSTPDNTTLAPIALPPVIATPTAAIPPNTSPDILAQIQQIQQDEAALNQEIATVLQELAAQQAPINTAAVTPPSPPATAPTAPLATSPLVQPKAKDHESDGDADDAGNP
jgi:hypothetical protein